MFNRIAPNSMYEKFVLKLKTLSEDELKNFIEQAKKIGISDQNIQNGLNVIKNLTSN